MEYVHKFNEECKKSIYSNCWDIPYRIMMSVDNHENMLILKQNIDKTNISRGVLNKHYDLHEIVYYCFNDEQRRNILNHIDRLCPFWYRETIIHIISDVDDTLFPGKIGGIDKTKVDNIYYPGVIEFHKYLRSTDYLTLLTTRPKILKQYMCGNSSYQQYLGKFCIVSATPTLTMATFSGIHYGVSKIKNKLISSKQIPEKLSLFQKWGEKKFRTFEEYKNLYPEYKLIFIGDSGQGDVVTSRLIVSNYPNCICFIHDVMYDEDGSRYYSDIDRKHLYNNKIYLFNSYSDACDIALNLNLITNLQANKIKSSC